MSSPVTHWLFATPVSVFDLSRFVTEEVNHALQKIGYTQNDLVEGIRGDEDPSKILALKPLYDEFQTCIDIFSSEMGISSSYIYESWMNILSMHGSVGVHRHYDSVISGAYYPYVDEGSAPIVFVSATEGFRMMDVQAAVPNGPGMYSSNIDKIEAKTGRLVLFPSWVQHYVPPNKTNMRITLSFNTKY
jgi:hypothetical protein